MHSKLQPRCRRFFGAFLPTLRVNPLPLSISQRQVETHHTHQFAMKTIAAVLLVLWTAALPGNAQQTPTVTTPPAPPISSAAAIAAIPARPDGYAVTEIGPSHRRWTRVTPAPNALGDHAYVTNSYVELQDSLYYVRQGPAGLEWAESKAEIEACPGGAIARQGPVQIIFPNDLSTEPIDAQTTAGRFRSAIVCLSYADYNLQTNLIIAEIQSCQGQIIAPNQVLYPKAFSDSVSGSMRYTYTKGGWEQDVLIDDPGTLPTPESMGLDSGSATLHSLGEGQVFCDLRLELAPH
jgi:hypothetical protein